MHGMISIWSHSSRAAILLLILFSSGLLALIVQPAATAQARRSGSKVILQPRRDQPAPKITIPGGRRDDGKCPQDRQPGNQAVAKTEVPGLTPIVFQPPTIPSLTFSDRPTLLVYVPATSARELEVTLEDERGVGVDQMRIAVTTAPGIVRVPLGEKVALEPGKDYRWIVAVVCESGDPKDTFSAGIVRRIQPNSPLLNTLQTVSPLERVTAYTEAGIWYEAIATLADLRRSQPKNPDVQAAWEELLQSAGLGSIAAASVGN